MAVTTDEVGTLSTIHLQAAQPEAAAAPMPEIANDIDGVLRLILSTLDDNKAEEVVTIDLRGKTSIADAMVVASGRSARHVGAIADHLASILKDHGAGKVAIEGMPSCDWVLVDVGDVIVHLFRPEVRAFYNLEKMWSGARPDSALAG